MPFEHCDFNALTNSSYGPLLEYYYNELGEFPEVDWGWLDSTYDHHARTTMQLETGGKAGAATQNLFVISATATDMLSTNPIPPDTIEIGGLGNSRWARSDLIKAVVEAGANKETAQ